jgi:two-component system sensor histidine kinase KdpD
VLGRSLVEALLRQSGDISVHVVPLAGTRTMWSLDRFMPPLEWRRYGWSALYVAIAAAAGVVFEQIMAFPSPQPFFFIAVLLAAVGHGFAASILASLLSFGAYNWFFIDPRYTFSIAQPHEIVALILFLFAAVLVSGLAARSRDQAEDARRRMRTQAALYDFSRKLATITLLDDILWATAFQLASAVRGKAVILLPEGDDLGLAGSYPPGEELDTGDITAARWAWQHGETAGHGSSTLPTRPWRFEPMTTSRGTIGVVGLSSDEGRLELDPDTARAVAALTDQSAVAFERSRLANEMAEARIVAATEKLRHALLSSISHDLRTPLAAIIGAVTSLKSFGDRYDANTRTDLLLTIEEEAQRLNGFVANLLDMTRLEAGMLAPKRDWVAVDDLMASAVQRARRHIGRHPISIKPHSELPLCRLDFVLFEQVLFNLIDNAAKYSPVGSPIELEARQDAGQVLIEVSDHGSGIPARDLERVFDKFYRIGVTDRRPAGTGLGLAICKGIVEAHGGTIRAISPGPAGDGTVIAVRLPVAAAPDMGEAA